MERQEAKEVYGWRLLWKSNKLNITVYTRLGNDLKRV